MTVAQSGSITRASDRLNLAQTALGQQMRQLEDSLDARLLVRHSRGIAMTEAGEVLYRHALSILGAVEEARREVQLTSGNDKEVVHLGVTPSVQALVGIELLERAREELPRITLNLVEELSFNLVDALGRGELAFALASPAGRHQGIVSTAILEEELLFVTAPTGAAEAGPIPIEEVAGTALALISDRDAVWRILHGETEKRGLELNIAFKVQSMPAIKALVARGAAASVLPYGIVAEEISHGLMRGRPIAPSLRRTLSLNRQAGRPALVHERRLMQFLDRIVRRLADRIGPHGALIEEGLQSLVD